MERNVIYVDTIDEEFEFDGRDFFNTAILPLPGTSLAKFLNRPEMEDGRTVDDVNIGALMGAMCLI